ncbi:MAG: alpha/beta fold hydrolase [Alphaproteobacteria bacterium]|nr:alpha/beta fold hydrolase [Alphaproteobacteria bacterium]
MRDGSGDRLAAALHRPARAKRPLVLLIHGLGGSENSIYMQASAAHHLARGHPVVRLSLRGAGPSRATCRLQYHAGRTGDVADAIAALPADLTGDGILAVGYSLGANVLLKLLGEGGTGVAARPPIRAAASVSAPIELHRAAYRFNDLRNYLYHRWMLDRMQREATAPGAAISDRERAAVLSARSVIEFDERFVAPRNGFAGAEDYYRRCSAIRFLAGIRVPTLVIHAENDPWIPFDSYRAWNWRANPAFTLAMTRGGGHVGFHAAGDRTTWHDRRIGAFFEE